MFHIVVLEFLHRTVEVNSKSSKMKTILFTICVLMSIHAAISIQRPELYDNIETCWKEITLNNKEFHLGFNFTLKFQPSFLTSFNYYQNIPNNLFNTIVNTFICALKKAGVINQEGEMFKNIAEQYCEKSFILPQNIGICRGLAESCTNACKSLEGFCTSEEVVNVIKCKLKNGLLKLFEFPLKF